MVEDAVQTNEAPKPESGLLRSRDAVNARWSPETVLSTLRNRPYAHTSTPVPFFHILERLKTTKREGWRRFGINHGESIADHMYRMSILTMLAPSSLSSRLNIPHCTKMALIHDMAESLVGDITPVDGISKSEKSRREETTMDYLCKDLLGNVDGGQPGEEIRQIWQEYEDNESLEAKFVHDVDKMELILQMMEYERSHEGRIDLIEFAHVANHMVLPEVRKWCDEVLEERSRFWSGLEQNKATASLSKEKESMIDEYYSKR